MGPWEKTFFIISNFHKILKTILQCSGWLNSSGLQVDLILTGSDAASDVMCLHCVVSRDLEVDAD